MQWMLPDKHYYGDSGNVPEEIDPTEIAYYVHCQCGLTPMEFVAWLGDQLVTLDAIDPECSK
jgi:hypothetical protein